MEQPRIIELPKFLDERGNLSFVENDAQLPFCIERVHWIYDVPGGEQRGGVAYKETEEFVIALSGSFNVVVHDGTEKHIIHLNRSYKAVYIPKGTWRTIEDFSTNSVALICASTKYEAGDAIRDFDQFLKYANHE